MKYDANKFSFAQLTSNTDGKTSGSGTAGVALVLIGLICFCFGVYDHMWGTRTNDVMTQSVIVIGIGAGLLGYRKYSETSLSINQNNNATDSETQVMNKEVGRVVGAVEQKITDKTGINLPPIDLGTPPK